MSEGAPHQWPPDVGDIGVQAGWAPESELEPAKVSLAARLMLQLGDMRDGEVEWRWFDPELAGVVLDSLVEDEVDEAVFNYYRSIRGRLREHGGLLVIAWARANVPST